jgi:thiamine-monophosphate kinase
MSEERTEINNLGEFGLIDHLTKNFEIQNVSTVLSIGDDAAVIDHFGKQTVITTDMLLEGVHFDLMYTPLKHLGYKAVVVNLSDIYAMNATPTQITIGIGFSNRFSVEALEEFYLGVQIACSQKGLVISVTAIGEVAPDKFIKRSTAESGDLICVSGDLGAAFLGLTLMEREKKIFLENPQVQPNLENEDYIVGRLLKPDARKDIIELLEQMDVKPTAMMDISDGLSSEVLHICKQSQLGCRIYEDKIPLHEATKAAAFKFGLDATVCALNGGEDYELIFTMKQADYDKITLQEEISVIGYMCDQEEGTKLITKGGSTHNITAQGWNAFS